VLSDNKVAQTLKLMTRPADTRLTPEVVRELCLRSNRPDIPIYKEAKAEYANLQ